ncbi:3-phosphoshikimate 1-carboxyvinyltransferase [Fusobacterium sp. PH5-44]|uniref:3-phosphoshikimate 1-carboxyvinyltransferase n=1 Tax=unclassified Fusobacterium TaxID=2648384 RepID=UPI003D222B82
MKVKIYPSTPKGRVKIPPSKSMAHRGIICAALANGTSKISNIDYSEDILATINGLISLGAEINIFDTYIIVKGIKNFDALKTQSIFCKESGSTLRFFIPIFSMTGKKITFTGENKLLKRPQSIYEDIFHKQNLKYYSDNDSITIEGAIKYGDYHINGNVSSQFISGLLFVLPLLSGDSRIIIQGVFESKSYVLLTMQILKIFGIEIKLNNNVIIIRGNQHYKSTNYQVEGDFSQFAFFAVLGTINNDITCTGLDPNSLQGDKVIVQVLKNFGGTILENIDGYTITKSETIGTNIDLKDCPDLGPILNVLMMYSKGSSKIYNGKRLRYKESDRIQAMEDELKKCSVDIITTEGEVVINGKLRYSSISELSGHKDHRIIMSLSIAATLFNNPTIINNAESVNKSYPNFFQDLKNIGIKLDFLE